MRGCLCKSQKILLLLPRILWLNFSGLLAKKSSCFIFSVITFPDEDPDFNVLYTERNYWSNKQHVYKLNFLEKYVSETIMSIIFRHID